MLFFLKFCYCISDVATDGTFTSPLQRLPCKMKTTQFLSVIIHFRTKNMIRFLPIVQLFLVGCSPQGVGALSSLCTPPTTTTKQEVNNIDWKNYDYGSTTVPSPLQRTFEKAGGVIYKTSVLSIDELKIVKQDITNLRLHSETTSSVARNRVGAVLSPTSETVRILQEGGLTRLVEKVMGDGYELSTNIPVEVRAYEKVGAGMEWHVDDVLYDPPQLEVVLTIENNSDCRTMWKESSGPQQQQQQQQQQQSQKAIETDDNSAILLRAGGVEHSVSSLKHGKRTIIKCAFRQVGATFLEQEQVLQFSQSGKKKLKKKQQRGGRKR